MELIKRGAAKGDLVPENRCPSCDGKGIVDFVDLVRGNAELHCQSCFTFWVKETEPTMAHLAPRR